MSVLFLLLDRIFIIVSPLHYHEYRHVFTMKAVVACILIGVITILVQYFADEYKQRDPSEFFFFVYFKRIVKVSRLFYFYFSE